jgi:tetraacyldisaccharide 4'-kinase
MWSPSGPLPEHLYAQVTRWRHRALTASGVRRRLQRPVISIGNLSVGGTGKTPVVADVARWLIADGHRPAILSRGYRRRLSPPGVVVVADAEGVRAGLDVSGDEPLMLARAVPGACVCVCEHRYLAGLLAERTLGATVHILDDGFQHVQLWRDLDVLVTRIGEIPQGHVLPRGRLREPLDAAARAHMVVVMEATADEARAEARALGIGESCGARRRLGYPEVVMTRDSAQAEHGAEVRPGAHVMAVAGIANPDRFAGDLAAAGYAVADHQWFRDHHRFTSQDVIALATRAAAASLPVVTTDKDAVRLEHLWPISVPLFRMPVQIEWTPDDGLRARALVAAMNEGTSACAS